MSIPASQPAETSEAAAYATVEGEEAAAYATVEGEITASTWENKDAVEWQTELPEASSDDSLSVSEEGEYNTRDEVALYLHLFGHLPANFITKNEARALGWDNSAGNLWEAAAGMSIGGDRFGNYEGLLPEAPDRTWRECDIGYEGGYRGACRILYSNDGLIYYTDDHYKTFTCLYDGLSAP